MDVKFKRNSRKTKTKLFIGMLTLGTCLIIGYSWGNASVMDMSSIDQAYQKVKDTVHWSPDNHGNGDVAVVRSAPKETARGPGDCPLNLEKHLDPVYPYIASFTQFLTAMCEKHGTTWFAWDSTAIQLLRTGALFSKYGVDGRETTEHTLPLEFHVCVAADRALKVETLLNDIASVLSDSILTKFNCESKGVIDRVTCSLVTPDSRHVRLVMHGTGVLDITNNEFQMLGNVYHREHIFSLNRVLPVTYASYYGLAIPMPRDPLYVFSHIVPYKDRPASGHLQYQYGQGCKDLQYGTSSQLEATDAKTIDSCGQGLSNMGYQTFYQQCQLSSNPSDAYVPYAILQQSIASGMLRFEDFPQTIVLHRGNGSYALNKPNGPWAQFGQDKYLDEFLNQKTNGFFIEVGGFDGQTLSNTLFMEKVRGWSGLLIEAIPSLYEKMLTTNRRCLMINACISSTMTSQTFIVADYLSTSVVALTDKFSARLSRTRKLENNRITCYCKSLTAILEQAGTRHVDYFSLDVEGGELIILNAIDWEYLDIDLFTIETDQHRKEIIQFMIDHGYEHVTHLKIDDVFRKIRPEKIN